MRQAFKRAMSTAAALGVVAGLMLSGQAPAAESLKIGILGGMAVENGFEAQECLMRDLADRLGLPVTVNAFASGKALHDALIAGEVDVASLSPRAYSALWRASAAAVQPVLAPSGRGGSKGYRAVALSLPQSDITTLDALKGREIGFADHRSLPGYFVPSVALERDGFKTENEVRTVQFSGGHHANLTALESGAIDAAFTWVTDSGKAASDPLQSFKSGTEGSPFVEVWRSSLMPNGPIVLRKALAEDVKQVVTDRMAHIGETAPDCLAAAFGRPITGLFPVDHADYETFIEADLKRISLSVASN
ncbi:phosphate/phosphite/phosphonate ABC transporter substrate-binding protein [Nisaea acidiphila]|uniref:Phosphate/phosphite/phosphonate ABC transporter substrate-binding protein n=1 Tax=Nisaea acidiphila TaxID=1862145 RepID=A0A9J7APL5_9PROT|nr:phosphate/phosphite/phosphonate ABC transporter substrate-binding protein [Nisaea acidiphila]UUX48858.1 phosphate/phosphite/phosphonate ABC transporter substrate-binding protein [Nisaea acidiphila]